MKYREVQTDHYLNTLFVNNINQYEPKAVTFTNKYADYRTVKESKLLMYPYTTLLLDDLKGNRQTLKMNISRVTT
jgi:hypothetical protein